MHSLELLFVVFEKRSYASVLLFDCRMLTYILTQLLIKLVSFVNFYKEVCVFLNEVIYHLFRSCFSQEAIDTRGTFLVGVFNRYK